MFKQLLQAGAVDVVQIDACRVGGVNENIAILLLAAKFGVPVCPHAGGVGLCEMVQHLAMFDFVAVSGTWTDRVIEYVDHLHEHFVDPVRDPPTAATSRRPRPGSAPRCTRVGAGVLASPTVRVWPEVGLSRGPHAREHRAATYVVIDVRRDATEVPARARSASTSRTPASAAPTCTSCTATWTTGSTARACIGHEMSRPDRRARRGRRPAGRSATR